MHQNVWFTLRDHLFIIYPKNKISITIILYQDCLWLCCWSNLHQAEIPKGTNRTNTPWILHLETETHVCTCFSSLTICLLTYYLGLYAFNYHLTPVSKIMVDYDCLPSAWIPVSSQNWKFWEFSKNKIVLWKVSILTSFNIKQHRPNSVSLNQVWLLHTRMDLVQPCLISHDLQI